MSYYCVVPFDYAGGLQSVILTVSRQWVRGECDEYNVGKSYKSVCIVDADKRRVFHCDDKSHNHESQEECSLETTERFKCLDSTWSALHANLEEDDDVHFLCKCGGQGKMFTHNVRVCMIEPSEGDEIFWLDTKLDIHLRSY